MRKTTPAIAAFLTAFALTQLSCSTPGLLKNTESWDYFKGATGEVYGDESAGFEGSWAKFDDHGVFEFKGAQSDWGCGLTLFHRDAPLNLQGATRIVLTAKATEGLRFYFYIGEDGVGPTDAASFKGKHGADGEQFYTEEFQGTEMEKEYVVEMDRLKLVRIFGNQKGDGELTLRAIHAIGFYVAAYEREGTIEIKSIRFE